MKRFQRLLVIVQPEFESLLAAWTGQIARSADSRELCLLHFEENPDPLLTEALGEPERRDGDSRVDELRDRIDGPTEMKIRTLTMDSLDQRALLGELERGDYDLVIAPAGEPGSRARAIFLCRKAPCPVLLLPANASGEVHRILVGIDFNEFSHDAINVASMLAQACELEELDLIHSWHQPVGYGWRVEDDLLEEQVEKTARERMQELADEHDLQAMPWKMHVRASPEPWIAITEAASELKADLTVICNRGKNALSEVLLGSDATEVVGHIDSACLVVKRKGASTGLLRELLGIQKTGEPA